MANDMMEQAKLFRERFAVAQDEIAKVMVGQVEVVRSVLTCLFVQVNIPKRFVPRRTGVGSDIKCVSSAFTETRSQWISAGIDIEIERF